MNFFHIINRGFEKKNIFLSKEDYLRFTHNLQDFNNREVAFLSYKNRRKYSEVTPPKETDKIVDVLCWSILGNHFHNMVKERCRYGASKFAQKITGGYTMYFNPRHQRSGTLFQGRSKVITVEREAHFLHLPFYVLANPLDRFQPKWRERGLKNINGAIEFLMEYRWSAFPDLMGKENFPKIINRSLFFELFDLNEKRFVNEFKEWLAGYENRPDHPTLFIP